MGDHCEFSICGSDQRWSIRMTTLMCSLLRWCAVNVGNAVLHFLL